MRNFLSAFFILISLWACHSSAPVQSSSGNLNTDSLAKQKQLLWRAGMSELRHFQDTYEIKWTARPDTFPYSQPHHIKVYTIDCHGECTDAVFTTRTGEGIEISKEDFEAFLKIMNDPASYGNSTAACYEPKFGMILYDQKNIPMEYMDICLSCNQFHSYPGRLAKQMKLSGFSNEGRKNLRRMFIKWGIDYYGYCGFWDDEKDYDRYRSLKDKTKY